MVSEISLFPINTKSILCRNSFVEMLYFAPIWGCSSTLPSSWFLTPAVVIDKGQEVSIRICSCIECSLTFAKFTWLSINFVFYLLNKAMLPKWCYILPTDIEVFWLITYQKVREFKYAIEKLRRFGLFMPLKSRHRSNHTNYGPITEFQNTTSHCILPKNIQIMVIPKPIFNAIKMKRFITEVNSLI